MARAFDASRGIDLYVMGDSTGEQYTLSSVAVQLRHNGTFAPTASPSAMPTTQPTAQPTTTHAPSTSSPTATRTTAEVGGDGVVVDSEEYGVTVSITLEYIFRDLTLSEIEDILLGIIGHLTEHNECKEAVNPMATEKLNAAGDAVTIINATIIVCDERAQHELLVAVNDPELQKDFVSEVDTATDTHIDLNRTSITTGVKTPA